MMKKPLMESLGLQRLFSRNFIQKEVKMTAKELLWSVDGRVMLGVKIGLSILTIKSTLGGTSIVDTFCHHFPDMDSEILNAPARIKEPVGDFTLVMVDMEDVNKMRGKKK
jgi:hypothetical protein